MAESFFKEIFYPLNQGDAGMKWLQFGNGIRNEMKFLYSQLNQLPPPTDLEYFSIYIGYITL